MPLNFVQSQRGKNQLADGGFLYGLLRPPGEGDVTWRCVKYYSKMKCTALMETTSEKKTGTIVKMKGEHNHAPDVSEINAKKIVNKMKKRAKSAKDVPTNTIVTRAMSLASASTATELPNPELLTRTVTRARAKTNSIFRTPESRALLEVPEEYQSTEKGDKFLYHDAGGDKNRFLIFTTDKNLDRLASCKTWQCDGTFKCVPTIFTQLYTLHGFVGGKLVPLVYALLPGKSEKLYKKVLEIIKQGRPNMNPDIIISDFEQAFIAAAAKVLPDSNFHGCYFHFCQCIYRHVQEFGYQTLYGADEDYANAIKELAALAFVPELRVIAAYEKLKKTEYFKANKKGNLKEIIEYFEYTWVGKKIGNRRTKPLFEISMWNCYTAILNDEPRTNNGVEGWHTGFNQRVSKSHAAMGKFIDTLKLEQNVCEATWESHLAGRVIAPPKRRKYANYDERLKRAARNYDEDNDLMEYLRGQSHNVKFAA